MSRYVPPLSDPRARKQAEDLARAAGRMGAHTIPGEAHLLVGSDSSDTAVHALLVALEAGQLERELP